MGLTRSGHVKQKSTSASAVSGSKISVTGVSCVFSKLEEDVVPDTRDETEQEAEVGLVHGEVAVILMAVGRGNVEVAGELELSWKGGYAKSRTLIGGHVAAGATGRGSLSIVMSSSTLQSLVSKSSDFALPVEVAMVRTGTRALLLHIISA